MDANVGDRISIDARTVGQPRRQGKVIDVTEGLSGKRYTVQWDDRTTSTFAPSGGNLIVERRGRGTAKKKTSANNKRPSSAKKASGAKKAGAKKAGAKKTPKKASGAKKAATKKPATKKSPTSKKKGSAKGKKKR